MLLMVVGLFFQSLAFAMPHQCCGGCKTASTTANLTSVQASACSKCLPSTTHNLANNGSEVAQTQKTEHKCNCAFSAPREVQTKVENGIIQPTWNYFNVVAPETFTVSNPISFRSVSIIWSSDSSPPSGLPQDSQSRAPPIFS